MALTLRGLTWPAKRGHVAHAHDGCNQKTNTLTIKFFDMKHTFQFISVILAACFLNFTFLPVSVLKAQAMLFEMLNSSSLTLTSDETAKLAQIQSNTLTETIWHVNVNPLSNTLDASNLTTTLPGVSGSQTFTADYVFSRPNGDYYWSGANLSGGQIRIGKTGSDYFGNISIPSLDVYYGIQKISEGRYVLVKYHENILNGAADCGTPPMANGEEDTVVEDRGSCGGNVIRVLFLFTSGAVMTGFDPYVVAPAVINELNASTVASGLSNGDISFALANIGQLNGFVESGVIATDLTNLVGNASAQSSREYSKADIVVLLTANSYFPVVGRAQEISASNDNAYCIAAIPFAATAFTATHEIGHLIGARHQWCAACAAVGCDDNTNHHGFPIGATGFRTIMMQQVCAGGRVGRWSNPDNMFMGAATGDNDNNNASILRSRADNVACFLPEPSLPIYPYFDNWVYLSGPYWVCDGDDSQIYSVSFSPLWFTPPVAYSWGVSGNGISPWIDPGCNTSQCTITGIDNLPDIFYVRATVTDVNRRSGTDVFKIKKVQCLGGGGDDRGIVTSILAHSKNTVYPNPFADRITIKQVEKGSWLSLTDLSGRVISRQHQSADIPEFLWDLEGLGTGLYFLVIENNNSVQRFKICKQ